RAYDSTVRIATQLELEKEDIGLICLNGMHTFNHVTQEKNIINGLSFEESLQFKDLGEKYHLGVMYCFDDCMYLEMDDRSKADYVNAMGQDLKQYFDFNVELKMIDSIHDIEDKFKKEEMQKIAFIQSTDYMNLVIDRMKEDT